MSFSETARYLDFISNKWKILSVKAPYKAMSSFQLGKDNNRVEMLLYLKIGIAKVYSKFWWCLLSNHECDCCIYGKTFIVMQ